MSFVVDRVAGEGLVVCCAERVVGEKSVVRNSSSQDLLEEKVLQMSTVGKIDLDQTLESV